MSDITIDVQNLGKKYSLRQHKKKQSLRDLINKPVFSSKQQKDLVENEFWALQGVSFHLEKGDTLGIIGRNGAGKSTLLKILAKVIHPTTGSATIHGKVASLLEVGTGFHPELTGRENVYFNGALIGMTKSEVSAKYKKIVDFSEIGDFIEMPIKQYSSGMKIRLAFSVAAHLESDVMIIDEALAVGDVNFKAKSMERMQQAASSGRTVLFVTHSMGSVQDLCSTAMLLEHGKMRMLGETDKVIDLYLGESRNDLETHWKADTGTKPNREINFKELVLSSGGKQMKSRDVSHGDEVEVEIKVDIKQPKETMGVGISLFDDSARRIFRSIHSDSGSPVKLKKGVNRLSVKIPTEFLKPGIYTVAADAEVDPKNWEVRPNATEARAVFIVKEPTEFTYLNPNHEAIIKPMLAWEKADK